MASEAGTSKTPFDDIPTVELVIPPQVEDDWEPIPVEKRKHSYVWDSDNEADGKTGKSKKAKRAKYRIRPFRYVQRRKPLQVKDQKLKAKLNAINERWEDILKQIEFYFGYYNMRRDDFFLQKMIDTGGWVPLINVLQCRKISKYPMMNEEKLFVLLRLAKDRLGRIPHLGLGLVEDGEEGKKLAIGRTVGLPTELEYEKNRIVHIEGEMLGYSQEMSYSSFSNRLSAFNDSLRGGSVFFKLWRLLWHVYAECPSVE